MKDERPTRIMIPVTDPNTKDTNQIVMDVLYQTEITNYINRSKWFKQNLLKSYTVAWGFFNKQLQN